MKKQLTEKTVYEPNKRVKISVTNAPHINEDTGEVTYSAKVSIAVEIGFSKDKLKFADSDDILRFIESIDVEDPQQQLI